MMGIGTNSVERELRREVVGSEGTTDFPCYYVSSSPEEKKNFLIQNSKAAQIR
jgi:hypothetical protein